MNARLLRFALLFAPFSLLVAPSSVAAEACNSGNTVTAKVVALDQAWAWNRYGALQPHGMMFALERDVCAIHDGKIDCPEDGKPVSLEAGHVILRPDKRPRPLVLRVNRGQCLRVEFTNLLDESHRNRFLADRPEHRKCGRSDQGPFDNGEGCGDQPGERWAGFHPNGLELEDSPLDDASHVGKNESSLVPPNGSITYTFLARHEGTFFAYSPASTTGGDGNGGSIFAGLFGAVNVEPEGSAWYRSQVRQEELENASAIDSTYGHRLPDYSKFAILGPGNEILHSDLTAIVDTRNSTFESNLAHNCFDDMIRVGERDPGVCADPKKPFREFTIIFHDESGAVQAFDEFDGTAIQGCEDDDDSESCRVALATEDILHSVRDGFAINYGTAGAGAEILANRKRLGPVRDCPECMMEEFFLSSWAVGDPAMVVDVPANIQLKNGGRPRGTYFPDDPSNVYHSYLNDRVVFRNLHAGPKEHHVFHLHAHQWLQTQYNPRSSYLDSQTIGPGGTYTYEIAYGGSGNRNRTAGDSIFHCHFYPHFAQGMWSLWRVHDVFEAGTKLEAEAWKNLKLAVPAAGARALPDGEITAGSPIPALLPMPSYALAPMPGEIRIANGQVEIVDADKHPGYPFFIPGKAGHRPPEPPLDSAHDGGLGRHVVETGTTRADALVDGNSRSLHKDWVTLVPRYLAEEGTPSELKAMEFHEREFHGSVDAEGNGGAKFLTNGRPRQHGAPFADPCPVDLAPAEVGDPAPPPQLRIFEAAAFQLDLIFSKKGWHTPQARMLALRDDVEPTMKGRRAPQPLFFRVNSGDCIEFRHSNLVPRYWAQDAFQIKSPTDVIGQHIHLVKFDVTSSDGSGNGFNYEDGTASYQEVQQRIAAIRRANGCGWAWPWTKGTETCPRAERHPWYGWKYPGGRVTIQRWYADPQWVPTKTVVDQDGELREDKTLETVFTHDHFGPSTHQQAGLYAGLIVEPKRSTYWEEARGGELAEPFGVRRDGGPTSWKAIVASPDLDPARPGVTINWREFGILYQDFLIAYEKGKDTRKAINAPGQVAADERRPKFLVEWQDRCTTWPHCPEAVSADDIGVMSINYRSEPAPPRLRDAAGGLAADEQGDLAFLFSSMERADPALNRRQDAYPLVGKKWRWRWPLLTQGMKRHDPFTPMLEVFDDERFKIRLLAGAHEHEHSFTLNGISWRFMPHERDSGERAFLTSALSEHHEVDGVLRIPAALSTDTDSRLAFDHLFKIGASVDDIWYGNWGLLRAYRWDNPPDHLEPIREATIKLPEEMLAEEGATTFGLRAFVDDPGEPSSRSKLITDFYRDNNDNFVAMVPAPDLLARTRSLSVNVSDPAADPYAERMALLESRIREAEQRVEAAGLRRQVELAGDRRAEALLEELADLRETLELVKAALAKARMEGALVTKLRPMEMPELPAVERMRTEEGVHEAFEAMAMGRLMFPKVVEVRREIDLPQAVGVRNSEMAGTDSIEDGGGVPVCPDEAPLRAFGITAVAAATALEDGTLVYHRFSGSGPASFFEDWRSVNDPTALLYVRSRYLDEEGKLQPGYKVEPLILRARAGDCIELHLWNGLPDDPADLAGYNTLPNIAPKFNFNQLGVSPHVGIHLQGLRYHVGESDGINVGRNPRQTITPGQKKVYRFYAGRLEKRADKLIHVPVERGVVSIMPADPIKQNSKGLIGALVVEPENTIWAHDRSNPEPHSPSPLQLVSRAGATAFTWKDGAWDSFRDLVLVGQNDANFHLDASRGHGGVYRRPVRRVAMAANCGMPGCLEAAVQDEEVDAVETGHKAFNYRSEAMWMRRRLPAAAPLDLTLLWPAHDLLADSFVGGAENQTPRFCVRPGAETRLRVAFPGGHGRNHILQVHGHSFPELPFLEDSTVLGDNGWTFHKGSQDGLGPGASFNLLLGPAGGENEVAADYLIRDQYSWGFDNGLWAVLDVDGSCPE